MTCSHYLPLHRIECRHAAPTTPQGCTFSTTRTHRWPSLCSHLSISPCSKKTRFRLMAVRIKRCLAWAPTCPCPPSCPRCPRSNPDTPSFASVTSRIAPSRVYPAWDLGIWGMSSARARFSSPLNPPFVPRRPDVRILVVHAKDMYFYTFFTFFSFAVSSNMECHRCTCNMTPCALTPPLFVLIAIPCVDTSTGFFWLYIVIRIVS